jgi:DUF4097 and DUF4098 domain-containing protein YvlB
MRKALIPTVFAIAASLAIVIPVAAAQETETVDRTVPVSPNGRVVLKTFSGSVTITGSARSDVVIHAVRRAPADRLAHIKLDVQSSGSEVVIDANKRDANWEEHNNNVVETDFEIQVPRGVSLDVNSFSAGVHVTGVDGEQRLKSFSGDLELQGARGPLTAETFSGKIDVGFDAGVNGDLDFDTFSGNLRTSLPLTLESTSKRHVKAKLGGGGSELKLKTFSGDVRLK